MHDELKFNIAVFLGLLTILAIITMSRGTIDRVVSSFNKDKITAGDLIYQTGNVRVYKFKDEETTCYVADKQSLSTAIYCK